MRKLVVTFLQRTKLILALAVLALVVVVALYTGLLTMINKKTVLYDEMFTDTQSQIDNFHALTSQKRLISDTSVQRDQLTSYFIDQGSVGRLFEKLEEIAKKTDVEFSVISARLGQKSTDGLRIQISADGTFRNVYYFFALLETIPFGINVKTLDMHTNAIDEVIVETQQPWKGIFDIEVITYTE